MQGNKTSAELDREIHEALHRELHQSGRSVGQGNLRFRELIRLDDPGAMRVAEDAILESGSRIRDATGGLHARNFTIEMRPLHGPREEWKMVQVSVDTAGSRGSGKIWTRWSVANGAARIQRERVAKGELNQGKQAAVATAWAIAKAIKSMPMDTPERKLGEVVDRIIARGKKNMVPAELF